MQSICLDPPPQRLLCLGAHSDDIEIGCGGTILRMLHDYPQLIVRWIVFGATGDRVDEARSSAERLLAGCNECSIDILGFRDGFFPYQGADIKSHFEQVKQEFEPDVVLTHQRHDAHQDHRLLCELTANTFRHHLILEYEIPKYDGDFGSPNVFVPLDAAVSAAKVRHLLDHFGTQRGKHWFDSDLFSAVLRLRGMECASPSGFAEAFYSRKISFSLLGM